MSDLAHGTNGLTKQAALPVRGELFVINLCASMTPMPAVPKFLKGLENHKLYQITRVEDGRHRYRLRLGFFNTEADAELALASVRNLYPAAFTSCAALEDMRFSGDPHLSTGRFLARETKLATEAKAAAAPTNTVQAKHGHVAQTKVEAPAHSQPAKPPVATPTLKSTSKPARPAMETAADEMNFEFSPSAEAGPLLEATTPKVHSTPTNAADRIENSRPFHVARGINVPDVNFELVHDTTVVKKVDAPANKPAIPAPTQATTPSKTAANSKPGISSKPTPTPVAKSAIATATSSPVKPAITTAATSHNHNVSIKKPVPAPVAPHAAAAPVSALTHTINKSKVADDYVPILDTTLTIRTLTTAEMEDPEKPKWFVVQLAISDHPFNLDAMPRLDIFAAYRLYSVVVNESAKVKHALRLGFFREEVSADAVSGYLKTFFPNPVISRIGIAEYERFVEPKMPPAAEPVPTATHDGKVVKLNEKRESSNHGAATHAAPSKPTFGVTPAPTPVRPKAATSVNSGQSKLPRGPSGKYSIAAVTKGSNNSLTSDSGIRQVPITPRPQSFFSKLIGRELD